MDIKNQVSKSSGSMRMLTFLLARLSYYCLTNYNDLILIPIICS